MATSHHEGLADLEITKGDVATLFDATDALKDNINQLENNTYSHLAEVEGRIAYLENSHISTQEDLNAVQQDINLVRMAHQVGQDTADDQETRFVSIEDAVSRHSAAIANLETDIKDLRNTVEAVSRVDGGQFEDGIAQLKADFETHIRRLEEENKIAIREANERSQLAQEELRKLQQEVKKAVQAEVDRSMQEFREEMRELKSSQAPCRCATPPRPRYADAGVQISAASETSPPPTNSQASESEPQAQGQTLQQLFGPAYTFVETAPVIFKSELEAPLDDMDIEGSLDPNPFAGVGSSSLPVFVSPGVTAGMGPAQPAFNNAVGSAQAFQGVQEASGEDAAMSDAELGDEDAGTGSGGELSSGSGMPLSMPHAPAQDSPDKGAEGPVSEDEEASESGEEPHLALEPIGKRERSSRAEKTSEGSAGKRPKPSSPQPSANNSGGRPLGTCSSVAIERLAVLPSSNKQHPVDHADRRKAINMIYGKIRERFMGAAMAGSYTIDEQKIRRAAMLEELELADSWGSKDAQSGKFFSMKRYQMAFMVTICKPYGELDQIAWTSRASNIQSRWTDEYSSICASTPANEKELINLTPLCSDAITIPIQIRLPKLIRLFNQERSLNEYGLETDHLSEGLLCDKVLRDEARFALTFEEPFEYCMQVDDKIQRYNFARNHKFQTEQLWRQEVEEWRVEHGCETTLCEGFSEIPGLDALANTGDEGEIITEPLGVNGNSEPEPLVPLPTDVQNKAQREDRDFVLLKIYQHFLSKLVDHAKMDGKVLLSETEMRRVAMLEEKALVERWSNPAFASLLSGPYKQQYGAVTTRYSRYTNVLSDQMFRDNVVFELPQWLPEYTKHCQSSEMADDVSVQMPPPLIPESLPEKCCLATKADHRAIKMLLLYHASKVINRYNGEFTDGAKQLNEKDLTLKIIYEEKSLANPATNFYSYLDSMDELTRKYEDAAKDGNPTSWYDSIDTWWESLDGCGDDDEGSSSSNVEEGWEDL